MQVFNNNAFKILCKPFGEYQTNCYIAFDLCEKSALIIDPGIGATSWIVESLEKSGVTPLAILNTHGHFDHVWSNAELQGHFASIPLLCHYEDAFMLHNDCFCTGLPSSIPTILVGNEEGEICEKKSSVENLGRKDSFSFNNFLITFICYPGHTPGCSVIELSHKNSPQDSTSDLSQGAKALFSGDFIFNRSIGRSDFPYSSSEVMKKSLEKFLESKNDMLVLPGHGGSTSIFAEKENIPYWLSRF